MTFDPYAVMAADPWSLDNPDGYLDLRPLLAGPTFEAERLLFDRIFTEARVHLAPGAAFHTPVPGYFRLRFATEPLAVDTAVTRLSGRL